MYLKKINFEIIKKKKKTPCHQIENYIEFYKENRLNINFIITFYSVIINQ